MTTKKTVPVDIIGATVCVAAKDKATAFLATSGIIYWLDLGSRKEFSKQVFREGDVVWVYVAQEVSRVIGVAPFFGEDIKDLPPGGTVEVSLEVRAAER